MLNELSGIGGERGLVLPVGEASKQRQQESVLHLIGGH